MSLYDIVCQEEGITARPIIVPNPSDQPPPRKPAQIAQPNLFGHNGTHYVYAEDIQTTNEERRELGVRRSA